MFEIINEQSCLFVLIQLVIVLYKRNHSILFIYMSFIYIIFL